MKFAALILVALVAFALPGCKPRSEFYPCFQAGTQQITSYYLAAVGKTLTKVPMIQTIPVLACPFALDGGAR